MNIIQNKMIGIYLDMGFMCAVEEEIAVAKVNFICLPCLPRHGLYVVVRKYSYRILVKSISHV